jgi:rhamnogalacturonyl hydrolase YesR
VRYLRKCLRVCALLGATAASAAHAGELLDVGLSGHGIRIEASVLSSARADAPTIALIGGLGGPDASVARVREALARFAALGPRARRVRVIGIALANPDGAALQFPPSGVAYRDHPESHALWRWIGLHAPDLVLIEGRDEYALAAALASVPAAEVGTVPARAAGGPRELEALNRIELARSQADQEMHRRLARTPVQLAEELARYYGHDFSQPFYINALALIGQLRLGHLADVAQLVEPYVDGSRNSLERPNSLVLGGHLVFTALARARADPRYVQRVRAAADLGFDEQGRMKEAMPFHQQLSDSIFMGAVIVAQAGALTGETRYFDMAARHVAFMQKLVLRPDGLYRHQPASDAAWARGNAFAALGLVLTLGELPPQHPAYAGLLQAYRDHMAVLARFQDPEGAWRNVIDYPGAFTEFSATAMIGFAMLRGIERGWLPESQYRPLVERAWQAVLARVGPEGHLVDVCESTPGQSSLADYLHRAALLGPDPRGGAMALLFATERAGLAQGDL